MFFKGMRFIKRIQTKSNSKLMQMTMLVILFIILVCSNETFIGHESQSLILTVCSGKFIQTGILNIVYVNSNKNN